MANHVNTYVQFQKLSDAGKAKLQELYSRVRTDNNYQWFSDMWGLDPEVTDKYDWNCENVGPKWCHFEDRGEDYFNTTSAWSYPEQGLTWVFEQIASADPEFLAVVTYEDEMPNFFGVAVHNKDGMIDGCEWESEEITEMMKEANPELAALNEETDADKYWEIWSDNIWELVHEKQDQACSEIMESLKE
jgi:hypothetical protein